MAGKVDRPLPEGVGGGGRRMADMRRVATMDFIARHRGAGNVESAHELPKVSKRDTGDHISKRIFREKDGDPPTLPPMLSDYTDNVTSLPSPLSQTNSFPENIFLRRSEMILVDVLAHTKHETISREYLRAGPRKTIDQDPGKTKAAIVSCGGLCPGINTVIRELVYTLMDQYLVDEVYGVQHGYRGFYMPCYEILRLKREDVESIHHNGGTILGSSRGGHDTNMIVEAILDFGFTMIFIIGGDGTHRGAIKIFEEFKRRKVPVSVVGIPKTIDNDIALIDRSFGFNTAVSEAQHAINSARTEATSAFNGIGLVKLMGRQSGHIAMSASLASLDVDVCLIPEVPFSMEGPEGLIAYVKKRLVQNGYCLIVVAEGAGMELLEIDESKQDASGNVKLPDIGLWLKQELNQAFDEMNMEINLKYIDPTYMIRTVPPNSADNLHCALLAQQAVHGAFAGYTGFTVGIINTHFVYIPMTHITTGKSLVNVHCQQWQQVLSSTGQPSFLRSPPPEPDVDSLIDDVSDGNGIDFDNEDGDMYDDVEGDMYGEEKIEVEQEDREERIGVEEQDKDGGMVI